ncbi:MAG: M48 family metallopeptidase [Actinobacteria bacterium]|nr:M48 family metallopeptidase [Actinomycetota bacterium]
MQFLVHPKEKLYFAVSLVISLLVYLALVISLVGIVYIILGIIVAFIVHGLFIGAIRGNGIRVSDKQLPEVYRLAQQIAEQMELKPVPAIYVLQSGGFLNAFATMFLGRNFVVIYAEVLELAWEKGESAVAFVISHEFAHIKRRHLNWRWLLYPAMLIPFLGSAYSRACEYTCDRIAAHYQPAGAAAGLLVFAAGKKLYRFVDPEEFSNQAETERGFWVWLAEVLSTHPNLPKRLRAFKETEAVMRQFPLDSQSTVK